MEQHELQDIRVKAYQSQESTAAQLCIVDLLIEVCDRLEAIRKAIDLIQLGDK